MSLFKKRSKKIEVLVYSKPDCHLCEEAKLVITKAKRRFDLDLKEVDITENQSIFEHYKEQIPVIFLNGRKAFKHRVNEDELLRKLNLLNH